MKKGWFIGTGISAVLTIMLLLCRDDVIIYAGLNAYRMGLALASTLLCGFTTATLLSPLKDRKRRPHEEAPVRPAPTLDIGNRLNPEHIKASLYEITGSANDDTVKKSIKTVIKTMNVMDELQDKLKELLDNNGADALRDTEDILDNVEQQLCRNVRKLINNITILDLSSPGDRDKAVQDALECGEQNQKLLKLTKDFMTSLVEFLNRQGDSSSEGEMEMYREAINEQLSYGH